jgi:hypothetical protein
MSGKNYIEAEVITFYQLKLKVDGKEVSPNATISRLLTETNCEDGEGIFNRHTSIVTFSRESDRVQVDFGKPFLIEEFSDITEEIVRRVNLVHNAFEAKKETIKKQIQLVAAKIFIDWSESGEGIYTYAYPYLMDLINSCLDTKTTVKGFLNLAHTYQTASAYTLKSKLRQLVGLE